MKKFILLLIAPLLFFNSCEEESESEQEIIEDQSPCDPDCGLIIDAVYIPENSVLTADENGNIAPFSHEAYYLRYIQSSCSGNIGTYAGGQPGSILCIEAMQEWGEQVQYYFINGEMTPVTQWQLTTAEPLSEANIQIGEISSCSGKFTYLVDENNDGFFETLIGVDDDTDADGIINKYDDDIDNDGIINESDSYPFGNIYCGEIIDINEYVDNYSIIKEFTLQNCITGKIVSTCYTQSNMSDFNVGDIYCPEYGLNFETYVDNGWQFEFVDGILYPVEALKCHRYNPDRSLIW